MSLTSLWNALERPERNHLSPQDELLIIAESDCIPSISSYTVINGRGESAGAGLSCLRVGRTTHLRTDVRAIIGSWSVKILAERPTG